MKKKILCKDFHFFMLKLFGMECSICGLKVIWEEKKKKDIRDGR